MPGRSQYAYEHGDVAAPWLLATGRRPGPPGPLDTATLARTIHATSGANALGPGPYER